MQEEKMPIKIKPKPTRRPTGLNFDSAGLFFNTTAVTINTIRPNTMNNIKFNLNCKFP
jgi:hypothetical protein